MNAALLRPLALGALLLAAMSIPAAGQQPMQSVQGAVRDSAGRPISGADVLVGRRQTTTDPRGTFRVDSLRPGQYTVIIRLMGYSPLRSRVAVVAGEDTEVNYFMVPIPVLLPTVVVEGRRSGIYGSVGDTAYRAAPGARVQVAGFQGGETLTDSTGRFAFPNANSGTYLVRVTLPGYSERNLTVALRKGEGREIAVLLTPSLVPWTAVDAGTIEDLGKRLSSGLARERLEAKDFSRYGSAGLCDVGQIRSEVGKTTTLVLNGTTILPDFDVGGLCDWRADEVELVEYGKDVCKDVTQTVVEMIASRMMITCSGRTRNVPRSIRGSGARIRTQNAGTSYVIIWEKR